MTRFVAVGLVVLGFLAGARVARAEGDPLPDGAVLSFIKFYIRENGQYVELESPDSLRHYFNLAHCVCSQTMAGDEQTFAYDLTLSADTGIDRPVEVWVGTSCNDDVLRPMQCVKVDSVDRLDSIRTATGPHIEVPTYKVINVNDTGACLQQGHGHRLAHGRPRRRRDVRPLGHQRRREAGRLPLAERDRCPAAAAADRLPGGGRRGLDRHRVGRRRPGPRICSRYQALCALEDDLPIGASNLPTARYQRPFDVCRRTAW